MDNESNFITSVLFIARELDWTANDLLLNFTHEKNGEAAPVGFREISKHTGGNSQFRPHIWAAAVNWLNPNYRERLFDVLKGKAFDVYLYEQAEDMEALMYTMEPWGWKCINE